VIDQPASRLETSAGNRSSQSSAPTARALFRTTAGTSIIASVSHLQPGATPITPAAVDGQARSLRRARTGASATGPPSGLGAAHGTAGAWVSPSAAVRSSRHGSRSEWRTWRSSSRAAATAAVLGPDLVVGMGSSAGAANGGTGPGETAEPHDARKAARTAGAGTGRQLSRRYLA